MSTYRGSTICRCCGSKNLTEILDLGEHPLPAEYGNTANDILEAFPLKLNICKNLLLVKSESMFYQKEYFTKLTLTFRLLVLHGLHMLIITQLKWYQN